MRRPERGRKEGLKRTDKIAKGKIEYATAEEPLKEGGRKS